MAQVSLCVCGSLIMPSASILHAAQNFDLMRLLHGGRLHRRRRSTALGWEVQSNQLFESLKSILHVNGLGGSERINFCFEFSSSVFLGRDPPFPASFHLACTQLEMHAAKEDFLFVATRSGSIRNDGLNFKESVLHLFHPRCYSVTLCLSAPIGRGRWRFN